MDRKYSLGLLVAAAVAIAACPEAPRSPRRPVGGSGGGDQTGGSGAGGTSGGTGGSSAGGAGGGTVGTGGSGGAAGARADGAVGGGGGQGTAGAPGDGGGGARDGASNPGDGGSASSCSGPRLPAGNRCGEVAQVVHGQGGDPLIDDFEPAASDTPTCRKIRAADGREGAWAHSKDSASPNGTINRTLEAPGPGGAPGSTRALRLAGAGIMERASLSVTFAPCYDASKYRGLSFWFKGSPGGAPYVKIWFTTAATIAADGGGACVPKPDQPNGECRDHFTVHLLRVSDVWTRYAFTWKQLAQMGFGQLAGGSYKPETEILGLTIAPQWDDAVAAPNGRSFDFWLDDLSFDVGGDYATTGFRALITKARFDAAFSSRRTGGLNSLYANAYADLAAALDLPEFSRVGREGSLDDRKRELAALMAHVVQETGALQHAAELAPPSRYCDPAFTQYPCASGQSYMGRGPLQLSWNYNYGSASQFFGAGNQYLANPGAVIANGATAWKVAAFTWHAWKDPARNTLKFGSHSRFLEEGFGATIRAINGALECPNHPAANNRRANYQAFCAMLGVGGCDRNLACPPS